MVNTIEKNFFFVIQVSQYGRNDRAIFFYECKMFWWQLNIVRNTIKKHYFINTTGFICLYIRLLNFKKSDSHLGLRPRSQPFFSVS